MTITRAPRGMKHLSRGRLEGDEFDTMCDNPHCTDPCCEGSCLVVGMDGTVLQNLKGPRDPNACKRCWEDPCGCHLLYPEDIGMPCIQCYGFPCRCESADDTDSISSATSMIRNTTTISIPIGVSTTPRVVPTPMVASTSKTRCGPASWPR